MQRQSSYDSDGASAYKRPFLPRLGNKIESALEISHAKLGGRGGLAGTSVSLFTSRIHVSNWAIRDLISTATVTPQITRITSLSSSSFLHMTSNNKLAKLIVHVTVGEMSNHECKGTTFLSFRSRELFGIYLNQKASLMYIHYSFLTILIQDQN